MLPPGFETPREVTLYYDSVYDSLVGSGKNIPFLYPWAGIGAFLVIGYMLIDHRNNAILKSLRYHVFALMCSFQMWVIITNRARHPAAAFGVGLLSAWGVLWVSTIMAVNDCQTDFKRIDRKPATDSAGKYDTGMDVSAANGALSHSSSQSSNSENDQSLSTLPASYSWQSCPAPFTERLDWILDVFCNFRGVGWNWQTSTVPSISEDITQTVESNSGIRRFVDRRALLKQALQSLVIGYLILDLIKVIIDRDAYFWGYMDAVPPSWLPSSIANSYVLVRSYRLLVSLGGMYFALWEIFKLGPTFFAGVLGPTWIGIRGEAWMNPPDMFGSFRCVLDHGLAGWWGGWWHQTFRVAFNAHSRRLLQWLGINARSEKGKIIAMLTAFFLSGCLHACASYTQLGETRPLMGPMRFFMLQPCGILFQMWSTRQLTNLGVAERSPKFLRQLINFIYVHMWFYFTGPMLVDDFAKGGVWLYEPVAISPLRGLGFGAKDDTWWCWWDGILFWRSGNHWWDTGIAA